MSKQMRESRHARNTSEPDRRARWRRFKAKQIIQLAKIVQVCGDPKLALKLAQLRAMQ